MLTLLVEAPLVYAATRSWNLSRWRQLACILLPSSITHPLAWHAMGNFSVQDYVQGLICVEALVLVCEALLLQALGRVTARVAWTCAALANTASALVGWLLL